MPRLPSYVYVGFFAAVWNYNFDKVASLAMEINLLLLIYFYP